MAIYNDYDDLLERFSIMTESPTANYTAALKYCCNNATPEIANRLNKEVMQTIKDVIKNCIKTYNQFLQEGKDANQLLKNWKQNTPCDVYAQVLQALNLPQSATDHKADFETLAKYIDCGFELYPCISKQDGDTIKYLPITLNGKIALYDTEEQKQAKDRHGITDKTILQELCNQTRTITDEYGRNHKIELFRIFPVDNKYIVIDIDTHAGKANGLMQWQQYIKKNQLDGTPHFKDLELFPCFVESANGGKHLYFRLDRELPQKIKNLATSIEISTKDHGETAAGSYRKGTKNNYYTLHGDLNNAPYLPLCILKDMQIEPPKPATTFKRTFAGPNNGTKWNQSLNGIVEKARTKGATPHDFAYWICKYCKMANDNDGTQYGKAEIENILFSLPELAQHDKNDTQGVINSFNF